MPRSAWPWLITFSVQTAVTVNDREAILLPALSARIRSLGMHMPRDDLPRSPSFKKDIQFRLGWLGLGLWHSGTLRARGWIANPAIQQSSNPTNPKARLHSLFPFSEHLGSSKVFLFSSLSDILGGMWRRKSGVRVDPFSFRCRSTPSWKKRGCLKLCFRTAQALHSAFCICIYHLAISCSLFCILHQKQSKLKV